MLRRDVCEALGKGIQRKGAQQVPAHAAVHLIQAAQRILDPRKADGVREGPQFTQEIDVAHAVWHA